MEMQSKHLSDNSPKLDAGSSLITTSKGAKERGVQSSMSGTTSHLELSPSKRSPRRTQFLDFLWKGSSVSSLLARDGGFKLPSLTKCERLRRPIERKVRGDSDLKLLATEDCLDAKSPSKPSSETRFSEGTASILSCTINLANTCIGTGMFGLPAAFASSGYALGSILLMTACLFAANGLRLLSMSAEKVGIRSDRPASFYSIASAALPQFTVAIDFAVALKCFGVATSYLITVGDCMVEAIRYVFQNHLDHMDSTAHSAASSFVASRQFWVLSAVIMVIPMSFHGTLDALHCASTLSLFLTYAVATGIILYAEGVFDPCEGKSMSIFPHHNNTTLENNFSALGITEQSRQMLESANATLIALVSNDTSFLSSAATMCQGEVQAWNDAGATLRNVAIFVFSFCCHQNIFQVVNEIKDRTQPRVDSVVTASMCSAFLVYFVVAIEGYLTFGSLVSGDILLSYPETAPVTLMRLAIAVMVILSYPLQLDPSRRSIMSLLRVIRECMDRRRRNKETMLRDGDDLSCSLHTSSRISGEGNVRSRTRLDAAATATTRSVADALEKAIIKPEPQETFTKAEERLLFNAITCVFLALSLGLAMVVKDLGIVLAVVGATGSTMISYILPGLIYIRLHPEFTFTKGLAILQLVIGCLITPTALYFVIFGGVSE